MILELPRHEHEAMLAHLSPGRSRLEQAAFVYAHVDTDEGRSLLRFFEWEPVRDEGFESRSEFHFELSDATRASVIKRAHDLEASLIEFHTHTGPWRAQFSPSDLAGFDEFVPHVLWRLKERPYGAVVVTKSGFDGLVWRNRSASAERLEGFVIEGTLFPATGLTDLKEVNDQSLR